MRRLIAAMYEIPIGVVAVFILVGILLWSILAYYVQHKKGWRITNGALCAISVALVYLFALSGRLGHAPTVSLTPFYSFTLAIANPDIYRQMMLNVLLFFPLGLTAPMALYRRVRLSPLIAVVGGLLISVSVEVFQYHWHCGYSEIDDVIFNTLGVILGTLSYPLFLRHNRRAEKLKQSDDPKPDR